VSSDTQPTRRRKPGQEAAQFKTDDDTGKMIIDDEAGSDSSTVGAHKNAEMVTGTAYRENITSVDGFARGSNGRVKFHRDTKKRRRENEDAEDVEMAEEQQVKGKKNKMRTDVKLGHEFKAKVNCSQSLQVWDD
jgi:ribosomal RNA-processing protein 12